MHLFPQLSRIEQIRMDEQRPSFLYASLLDTASYDLPRRCEHQRSLAEIIMPFAVFENAVNPLAGNGIKAKPKCCKLTRALRIKLGIIDQANQRMFRPGRTHIVVQTTDGLDITILAGHNFKELNNKS